MLLQVEVSTLSTVKELKLKALAAFQLDAATLSDSAFLKTGNEAYEYTHLYVCVCVCMYVCMYDSNRIISCVNFTFTLPSLVL